MNILHIEGFSNKRIELTAEALQNFKKPGKIALCTTIQFIKSIESIKKQLENAGNKVILLQGGHSSEKGQILGCDVPKIREKTDLVLFVGDGLFHPKALFIKNNIPVYAYNPYSKDIAGISADDVKDFEKFKRTALAKFYSSENIGVIISIKPGQNLPGKKVSELEKKYPKKKFYRFVSDTIEFSQMENFPFIECWVNTACPRIAYDEAKKIGRAIINFEDLLKI